MSILLVLILGAASVYADHDGASPGDSGDAADHARVQATRLMNAGLPFVEQALATSSEFPPFGAVMLPTGKIQTLGTAADPAGGSPEQVYGRLVAGLRDGAASGSYRAVATFALVELRHPDHGRIINAVHVALEHQDGFCANVYYPTVLEGESLVLGEAFAGRRAGTFFAACIPTPGS